MSSCYSKACDQGFPYVLGATAVFDEVLLSKFGRKPNPQKGDEVLWVGWSVAARKYIYQRDVEE